MDSQANSSYLLSLSTIYSLCSHLSQEKSSPSMVSRSRLSSMGHDSDSRYSLLLYFLRIFAYEKNQISGFIIISTTLGKHSLVSQTKMRKNSSENFSRSTEYEEKQPSIFSDLAEKTSSRQYNSKTISSSPQFLVSGRRQLRRSSWI